MYFENFLNRADLDSIQHFLKCGGELFLKSNDKTYEERIKIARKKAVTFFEERFPDIQEFDEVLSLFDNLTTVYEEVYFEIGMLLGAKIGFEICGKIEQLK